MPDDVVGSVWSLVPSARSALHLELARRALRSRDLLGATIELEELLDDEPDRADALGLLAVTCIAQQDWPTARHALRTLHTLTEGTASTWAQLAQAELECWDFPAAEDAAHKALQRHAENGDAWHVLGWLAERQGALSEADEHHLRAWQLSPLAWPLPFRLELHEWEELVHTAMDGLDDEQMGLWSEVPLRLEPFPEQVPGPRPSRASPRDLIRYDGDPDQDEHPSGLRVFWGNLAHTGTVEALLDQLLRAIARATHDWLLPEAHEE